MNTQISLGAGSALGIRLDSGFNDRIVRGDSVVAQGGARGMFVGLSQAGVVWVCYNAARFMRMCAAFDRIPVRVTPAPA